jgi:hypothetical protein
MIIRAYLPKFLTALFGVIFIAAGIFTFGNGLIFDRLYIAVLIFTGIVCRKDINVVGVVVILCIERLVDELFWYLFVENFYNILHVKFMIYIALGCIIYKLWFDGMTKLALPCLVASVLAEIYWMYAAYENTPGIYWYNIVISLSLIVRFLLFSRINLTDRLLNKIGNSISLDWYIYQVTKLYIITEAINLLEYLLRHILNLPDLQFVYPIYPYIIQSIATFTLWIVFSETNKLLKSHLISA